MLRLMVSWYLDSSRAREKEIKDAEAVDEKTADPTAGSDARRATLLRGESERACARSKLTNRSARPTPWRWHHGASLAPSPSRRIALPAVARPFCRRSRSRLVDAGADQYNSHLLRVRAREIPVAVPPSGGLALQSDKLRIRAPGRAWEHSER